MYGAYGRTTRLITLQRRREQWSVSFSTCLARFSWSSSPLSPPPPPPSKKSKKNSTQKRSRPSLGLKSRTAPSEAQYGIFKDQVESLIKKNASPPSSWKNPELKHLEQKLLAANRGRKADSLDKVAFLSAGEALTDTSTGKEGELGETSDLVLVPGCFVEIRRSNVATNAVVLGSDYIDRRLAFTSITSNGEIWSHIKDDVSFDIPNFVSSDIAAQCGLGVVAENKAELAARVQVLKDLRKLQKDCEAAINMIGSRGLDVYETVRRKDDATEWGETTVNEVARLLLPTKQPSVAHIFAAHKYLVSNSALYVVSHDYNTSRRFEVRPFADVKQMERLGKWTMEKDEDGSIEAFVQKAKDIITRNQIKSPGEISLTRTGLPTREVAKTHIWSPSDVYIISFLLQFLRPQYHNQHDPFLPIVQRIVKRIYDKGDVYDEIVQRLLIDIGAIAPWQDLTELRENIRLDLNGKQRMEADAVVEHSFRQHKSHSPTYAAVGQVLGPEDFYPTDPVEVLRHDFGDMLVYVIDDANAQELDDGVSVEPVPNEPDRVWLHIHIADPTSVLPPTHILARQAEARTTTSYLYQRTYPMLPTSFTHHPIHGISLGCRTDSSHNRASQPTLTFSVKVDTTTGSIFDYLVRPGIVRNITVVSYEAVDAALGLSTDNYAYPFGGAPTARTFPTLPECNVEDFKVLYKITKGFVARRFRDGLFILSRADASLYDIHWPEFETPIPGRTSFSSSPERDVTAYTYTGFPSMSYRVITHDTLDYGARSLVAELMKLGSRVASMFARDRQIPILRRWAIPPVIQSEEALADILNARTSNCFIETKNMNLKKYIVGDSIAGNSTDLKGHWGLGIPEEDGYARATSPLRRHADMINHWQIKQALLSEHLSRSSSLSLPSIIGLNNGKSSLYTKEWLDDFGIRSKAADRFHKRVGGLHQAWWHISWLIKWFEKHRRSDFEFTSTAMSAPSTGPLQFSLGSDVVHPFHRLIATNDTLPHVNRDSRKWQSTVSLDALGLKAAVVDSSGLVEKLEIGDTLEVEVNAMRLGVRPQIQVIPKRR